MKHLYFLIMLCTLIPFFAFAQNHSWDWAETAVQPNASSSGATFVGSTTDQAGNIIVAGYFYGSSVTLGAYNLQQTGINNTSDILIAKYDPTGRVLWATSAKGKAQDEGWFTATDHYGNVYVTGFFNSDSLWFDQTLLLNHNTTDTVDDIFLAKYDANGNLLWAKSYGGKSYEAGEGITVDNAGNVYVTGFYESDSVSFDAYVLHNTSNENAYIFKCDSNGNIIWATGSTSTGVVSAYGISTDVNGHVFITGRFNGTTADFGTNEVDNQQVGEDDIFVAQYDSAGNPLWAVSAGGSYNDRGLAIATDAAGNAFVTGYYNSLTAYFGLQQLINDTTNRTSDVFVAKYDPSGNLVWVKGGNGNDNDVAQSIATDTAGNVYVAGYYYSGSLIFDNDTLNNFDGSLGTDDIFVAEYNGTGGLLRALTVGNVSNEAANGITTDVSGNAYVTGFFRSDQIAFGDTVLNNSGSSHFVNPFLAKIAPADVETGVNNLSQQIAIELFPNPASDVLIARSESFDAAALTLKVYEVNGREILVPYQISGKRVYFNVNELADGMYWVRFKINGAAAIGKFVVTR